MKEGIHPNYREVLFIDMSNDFKFVTRSTINTRETADSRQDLPAREDRSVVGIAPVLHRPAKDHGHGRPRREVQQEVRSVLVEEVRRQRLSS